MFRRIAFTAAFIFLLTLVWHKDRVTHHIRHQLSLKEQMLDIDLPDLSLDDYLPCNDLPGASDVLVIVKTGFNVARKRLPMHMETTYRCIPNLYIYSDAEDTIGDHKIHDCLADIDPKIVAKSDDFRFYRKIKEAQQTLLSNTTAQSLTDLLSSKDDADDAWRLDKWKNIPLLLKAYQHKPDAKWYLFLDGDTYPVWSNILHWLSRKNHNKRSYLGCQAWIGDTVFGHGGSGYILSSAAMTAAIEVLQKDVQKYYRIPDRECCGDVALSIFLTQSINLNLTASWPVMQGETPESLDYTQEKWCKTAGSYHHVDPDEVDALWRFEQHWIRWNHDQQRLGKANGLAPPILHRDVFDFFVKPLLQRPITEWDNDSRDRVFKGQKETNDVEHNGNNDDDEEEEEDGEEKEETIHYWRDEEKVAHTSFAACRKACELDLKCLGYSYIPGECRLGYVIRLGARAKEDRERMRSGWMTERIDEVRRSWDPCEDD